MEFEFNSHYLILIGILLCLYVILFYLIYKLYLKTNDHTDKLDKLDKLLAEIFINKELLFDTSSKEDSKEASKESIKTKKRAKIEDREKEDLNEISETNTEIQND